jgi:hypothetical protein
MNSEEAKKAAKLAKRKEEALARQSRLQAAQIARSQRHVLCVDGNPNLPITVDSEIPAGTPVVARIVHSNDRNDRQ